jgi:hypothetical protein
MFEWGRFLRSKMNIAALQEAHPLENIIIN